MNQAYLSLALDEHRIDQGNFYIYDYSHYIHDASKNRFSNEVYIYME